MNNKVKQRRTDGPEDGHRLVSLKRVSMRFTELDFSRLNQGVLGILIEQI